METATLVKTKWSIDKAHSEIQFRVRHLMITSVTGVFRDFSASVETEGEDFAHAQVHFSTAVNSVDTGSADRDSHLKSGDFFDAENFPQITFESKEFIAKAGSDHVLRGDLTIRGVTQPVVLNVEPGGIVKDPWGKTRAGFTLTGKINRKDFGLNWNAPTEAGGVMVSEEVRIMCSVQLVKE